MHKAIVFTAMILFLATTLCLAEELTITTYYPSPFGVYNQLNTNTLGVGDNDGSGSLGSADAPDPNTNPGDIWVAGDVGIGTGTMGPQDELDVEGIIRVSTLGSADTYTNLCYNSSNQIAGCPTPPFYTNSVPYANGETTASCDPGDIVVGGGVQGGGGIAIYDFASRPSGSTGWYCKMIGVMATKISLACYVRCLRQ